MRSGCEAERFSSVAFKQNEGIRWHWDHSLNALPWKEGFEEYL